MSLSLEHVQNRKRRKLQKNKLQNTNPRERLRPWTPKTKVSRKQAWRELEEAFTSLAQSELEKWWPSTEYQLQISSFGDLKTLIFQTAEEKLSRFQQKSFLLSRIVQKGEWIKKSMRDRKLRIPLGAILSTKSED